MIAADQSPIRERAFQSYLNWYLPRCFHTVYRIGDVGAFVDDGATPLLVAMNHTSWWDVLLGLYAERKFFGWERYGVMDERQLRRYRFFAKLGMIGVDRTSLGGSREFLAYARELLQNRRRSLWVTPQGEMLSTRQRPIRFQPGLAHIAHGLNRFYFTTVALHYEFWNERLPEAFISLSPVSLYEQGTMGDRRHWQQEQEQRLEQQLDDLLAAAQSRNEALFVTEMQGKVGVNAMYDALRRLRAGLTGERFVPEHGGVVTPKWQRQTVDDSAASQPLRKK